MPSILSEEDKQIVKRTVPKPSNKIHAVAVARLYIAYPNRSRWTYTGIQGAAVLANDLVGNTYWIKMVDISPANRGVIWDQEIYDTFSYNQDRTFFHTFELEGCLAGLSFADEKEAKTFKKKMDEREKNAHKNTRSRPFATSAGGAPAVNGYDSGPEKSHHSFLGGLFGRDKHSSSPAAQPPPAPVASPLGRSSTVTTNSTAVSRNSAVESIDPELRTQLAKMGISEDQLADNFEFIQTWIAAQKTTQLEKQRQANSRPLTATSRPSAPAPPPSRISPQNTGGTSKRGPAPAPPPPRRGATRIEPTGAPSPPPAREPTPPPVRPAFKVPPPIADAGRLAHDNTPSLPSRARATSTSTPNAGPPPPPRPPKTPLDDAPDTASGQKFAVPPPFVPAPPPRAAAPTTSSSSNPPPPPSRNVPPPMPNVPPPPSNAPAPPPLPPPSSRPSSNAPPPPPLPPPSSSAPPPPPLPPPSGGAGGPPPPPLPPGRDNAPPPPKLPSAGGGGRGALLGDIRSGAKLKKVSDADKMDRSGALVPGQESSAGAGGGGAGAASGGGADAGLAGALASALAARKSKVSHSDDEDDKDDW